ncbi:ATP-binding protein [Methanobacterium alcaliphilum]|uniref:ATP-binding protein n=1 Tax=Methanobacterium alcaliphilum TaxID=392018 RepID=UPI00200B5B9B|nr:ATP-binding protein [Methanobacterium alcaliphilum]MCK9150620.1 ATP-binding protein [Methanobacterium alcaliphilum]
MSKITVPADIENLSKVINFVDHNLETLDIPIKIKYQLELAIEEAYVNIAKYAYKNEKGDALIKLQLKEDPLLINIQFMDSGIPYNPLEKEDPDISLKTAEKTVGGLGIYLIKKNVDYVDYEYANGKNILTIQKKLKAD